MTGDASQASRYHNIKDVESRYASRAQQAAKIIAILKDFCGPRLDHLRALEIGCASGGITLPLAGVFGSVCGIDVDADAVQKAAGQPHPANISYLVVDRIYALQSESFDVAVCTQVYEHTQDQPDLAAEIWRLLRPNGTCFFSGPNRLALVEAHYWLPFLSWLPRPLANAYMRLARRGPAYNIYPLSYWQLKRLFRRFKIVDYTLRILQQPERFAIERRFNNSSFFRRLPLAWLALLTPFLINYNWILVKQENDNRG